MSHDVKDRVVKSTGSVFMLGTILAIGRRSNGESVALCEKDNGDLFVSDLGSLQEPASEHQKGCMHDMGFFFNHRNDRPEWECRSLCGYGLPYDPVQFPEGIVYTSGPKRQRKIEIDYSPDTKNSVF